LEDLKSKSVKPPKFSLANNLWVGKPPWALQVLTYPEQLLVALVFPRVYVFKLFPKGYPNFEPASLQRGMRGTVSTFEVDVPGIASMIKGNLMPRPPAILASVIIVTFIAVGEFPKRWLRSTFRVRRSVVADALRWLKANNPKYYGDIVIDDDRLATLPEDDVPDEILSIVRQTEDVGLVDQEESGYVPDDESPGIVF
jgi:hypothetical protein